MSQLSPPTLSFPTLPPALVNAFTAEVHEQGKGDNDGGYCDPEIYEGDSLPMGYGAIMPVPYLWVSLTN